MEKTFGKYSDEKLKIVRLSVIVPVYNVEKFLPKCIESILNQTYKELEIFLIDDGSVDKCPEICDRYAQMDKRIRVIHKKNEGLVRARKAGLDVANGEYITFVDGDDWIEEKMYQNLIGLLEESGADFVDSGYFCDKNEKSYPERCLERGVYELDKQTRHKAFLALLKLDDFFDITPCIWSKIYKASIIKDSYAKVPDRMQYGEDAINILYCIMHSKKMLQVKEVFYHYNYREESMSHIKSNSYIRRELELWNYCGNIILNNDEYMQQEDLDRCLFQKLYFSFKHLFFSDFDSIQYFTFPNIERLFDKKLVIYGAGNVGRDYITQISKYEKCQIVCWVDRNYEELKFPYRKVIEVEEFLEKPYDIVLIAVEKKEMAKEIRQTLLEKGVSDSKILWCEPAIAF